MPSEHLPEGIDSTQFADRHAFEWGLAALTISAVLVTAAPIMLVLAVGVWSSSCHESGPVLLHAWLARIGIGVVLMVTVLAIGFGAKAVRYAAKRKQPAGVAVGGLSLSIVALVLWVITAIAFLNTTESLLYMYCR
jgi:hypothetical protein